MRVFTAKQFSRFARRESISDDDLAAAISRAEAGKIDASLGGGLIKQRIPRRGKGRSGGYRTVIAYRRGELAVFLHGFAKSRKADLTDHELEALKRTADVIFGAAKRDIEQAVADGQWKEIEYNA